MPVSCDSASGPVFTIYVGDLRPSYTVDVSDCDGPVDFTGWTLTFEMRGPVTVTGLATGDAFGAITHFWIAGQTDVLGDYQVIFHGVSPSPESKPQTFVAAGVVSIVAP
jgi:hypothetical protein